MKGLLVALPLLAACGGGQASPPTTAATRSPAGPSATPTPTATTLSIAQAAQAYLRIQERPNADLRHVNTFVGHPEPLATMHYWGRRLQRDLHAEAVALRTTRWPANVGAVASKMADAEATVIADLQGMATATSNDDAVSAWDTAATDTAKSARLGEQIRELLGLPPA